MIDFLIKSTLSLIVFLGFYYLVLEREKMYRFNRFYLLTSILFSLLLPFITFEVVEVIEVKPIVENIEPVSVQTVASAIKANVMESNTIPQKESINYIPFVLWSLYILVTIILFVRFGKNIWKLILKSKYNPIVKYENAKLVLVQEDTLPYSFLNYIFLNANDYHNNTIEKELYTHELVHVNQKHTLDILGIELLKCIFWFNPLLYFFKKTIQLNHEFLADEKVVNSYKDVPFYQNLLLNKCSAEPALYLTSNINYLVTKKRLLMMTKTSSKTKMNILKIIVLPVVLLLIYSFCIKKVSVQKDLITVETKIKPTKEREVNYLNYKVSDEEYYKDVVCVYYECIDRKIKNPKNWPAKSIVFSKKYQDLTNEERKKFIYLDFRQKPTLKKSPTQKEINDFLNSKKYAIWIDDANVSNTKLKNYKPTDFACFSGSVILKNARTKKHPQPFQYWFHTQKHYKENNMDKWLSRYPGDSIVMVRNTTKTNSEKEISRINDVNKKRDFAYEDLVITIVDKDNRVNVTKKYEDLDLKIKQRYLKTHMFYLVGKRIPNQELFKKFKNEKKYLIFINDRRVENEVLDKMKRTNIYYYAEMVNPPTSTRDNLYFLYTKEFYESQLTGQLKDKTKKIEFIYH